jgi:hypothetical protein
LLILLATAVEASCSDAGGAGNKELYQLSPPRTLKKIPAPPVYKPMPAQPGPLKPIVPERKGALNPKTGEFYSSHGEGVINPRTGEYYPPSGSGYINPRTGELYPSRDGGDTR